MFGVNKPPKISSAFLRILEESVFCVFASFVSIALAIVLVGCICLFWKIKDTFHGLKVASGGFLPSPNLDFFLGFSFLNRSHPCIASEKKDLSVKRLCLLYA